MPREAFAGKPVFVGATALELGDVLAVPVYGSLPGMVVQAMATETVIQGAPHAPASWGSLPLLAFWTLVAALAFGRQLAPQSRRARDPRSWPLRSRSSVYAFAVEPPVLIGIAAPSLVVARCCSWP